MSKTNLPNWQSEFSKEAIQLSQLEVGLKLISTIDERGLPHITLITFNKAKTPIEVVWGQFTEGHSKKNILKNPKQGLFYMNAAMPFKFVQAKVDYDHLQKGGEDCEYFSRLPLLRYTTYTNVHTVYYNNVVTVTPVRDLGIFGILKGAISQMIGKGGVKSDALEEKIPDVGMDIFNQLTSAKFISYIDPSDGYPVIIPCFQLRAPDKSRLIFPLTQFKDDLMAIPKNAFVSTFGIISDNLELVSQVIKGRFTGFQKARGINFGVIEVEEVYNSMPPLAGNVYPKLDVRPKVTDFHL